MCIRDRFYYDEDEVWDDYEFELDTLTFYADRNADEDTLTFDITMHGVDGDEIDATLAIEIGEGTTSSTTKVDGDIIYEVDPDDTVTFDRDDFWEFLDDETGDDLEYVRFTDATGLDDWGELYSYDYYDDRVYFDEGDLDDGYFYYDSKDLYLSLIHICPGGPSAFFRHKGRGGCGSGRVPQRMKEPGGTAFAVPPGLFSDIRPAVRRCGR